MAKDLSQTEIIQRELTRFKTSYYRDHFRRAVRWLSLLIVINAVLVVLVGYLYFVTPTESDTFYASNVDTGAVSGLNPLSKPVIKPGKLLQWVQKTVLAGYSYNFVNYRDVFKGMQKSFTAKGWQAYQKAMHSSRLLDDVLAKNLFLTAEADGQPIILSDGVINGYYAWKVQVPIVVSYKIPANGGVEQTVTLPLAITLIVVRIANLDNPNAIAITSFEAARSRVKPIQNNK